MTDYSRDRIAISHPAGFTIITPKGERPGAPLFCPVCEELMRDASDPVNFIKWKCCQHCTTYFAEPNKIKWLDGWRPSSEQLKEYTTMRKNLPYLSSKRM